MAIDKETRQQEREDIFTFAADVELKKPVNAKRMLKEDKFLALQHVMRAQTGIRSALSLTSPIDGVGGQGHDSVFHPQNR